jgi:predicted nuclease of predicted toxin-antitoxin system
VRFLIDAQLPPALARLLTEHGHQAEHVHDIGRGDAPDRELWQYALDHDAVIVTKDEDFAHMSALGDTLKDPGSGDCSCP